MEIADKFIATVREMQRYPIPNPHERDVPLACLRLLHQVKDNKPLNQEDLAYLNNKVRKVFCFSQSYGGILRFLEQYKPQPLSEPAH